MQESWDLEEHVPHVPDPKGEIQPGAKKKRSLIEVIGFERQKRLM
jgi:hypothetical protein